jgi:hypothetical protein
MTCSDASRRVPKGPDAQGLLQCKPSVASIRWLTNLAGSATTNLRIFVAIGGLRSAFRKRPVEVRRFARNLSSRRNTKGISVLIQDL